MTNYTTKSMNGIITIDDGMGTVISGGTISTDDLQLTNLICDNIQGSSPSDDVYLYTNTTTGTINIGAGAAASATTIRTDNLEALTGNTINIGRSTDSLTYPGVYNKFAYIDSMLTYDTLNIGSRHIVNGMVSLGTAVSTIRAGIFSFIGSAITSNLATGTINFLNNLTTGTLNIATSLTTNGTLNLGSTTSTTNMGNLLFKNKRIYSALVGDTINLFDNITTGIINVATSITTGGKLILGSVDGMVSIGNFLNCAPENAYTYRIYPNFAGVALAIGNTTGNTQFSDIYMYTPGVLSLTGGRVDVSNYSFTTSRITLKNAGAMEVGNFGGSLNTQSMNFNTGGTLTTTGIITVGGPASVNISPSLTTGNYVNVGSSTSNSNSGLRVYTPITVNYGSNWNFPGTNQIGQLINSTYQGNIAINVPQIVQIISNLPPGCYIVNATVNYSSQTNWNVTSISEVQNAHDFGNAQYGGNPYVNYGVNLSCFKRVAQGTTKNLYLTVQCSPNSSVGVAILQAMRIA